MTSPASSASTARRILRGSGWSGLTERSMWRAGHATLSLILERSSQAGSSSSMRTAERGARKDREPRSRLSWRVPSRTSVAMTIGGKLDDALLWSRGGIDDEQDARLSRARLRAPWSTTPWAQCPGASEGRALSTARRHEASPAVEVRVRRRPFDQFERRCASSGARKRAQRSVAHGDAGPDGDARPCRGPRVRALPRAPASTPPRCWADDPTRFARGLCR